MTRAGAALAAAWLCGCAVTVEYVATDGQVFRATGGMVVIDNEAALEAVRASAAHDLGCPREQIAARHLVREDYVADGCGQRAAYKRVTETSGGQDPTIVRAVLVSRSSLDPARPAP